MTVCQVQALVEFAGNNILMWNVKVEVVEVQEVKEAMEMLCGVSGEGFTWEARNSLLRITGV